MIFNHNACLSSFFVCASVRYIFLNTSLFIMYMDHISHHDHQYFICRHVLALILKKYSDFKMIIFLIIIAVVGLVTVVLRVICWQAFSRDRLQE